MDLLKLKDVSKSYDNKEVLKNININVEKGETLAFIGPTGCGKTTLLRLIDLLEEPDSGKIYFDGIDTNTSKKKQMEIRRRIGMVFQQPIVFKGTVYENTAYGLKIRGKNRKYIDEKVEETLHVLGLSGYQDRDASTLSGGETQRLALARVLVTEPELMILDEPTANLDPISSEKIENVIKSKIQRKETSLIMATHDLIQGQNLSDKIAILNGKISQIGTPEEIFRKPKNKFVADFVGVKNLINGTARISDNNLTVIDTGNINIYSATPISGKVHAGIRPEDIIISTKKVETSARNFFKGKIKELSDTGALVQLRIEVGEIFIVLMTRQSFLDLKINVGMEVWIYFKASAVHVF